MEERKNTIMLITSFLLVLALGVWIGYSTLKYEIVHYEGTVIGKNYEPRKIETVEKEIFENNETHIAKTLQTKDASFTLLIENIAGEKYRLDVSEEVFNIYNVGDKFRR